MILGGTILAFLKPRFRRALRPFVVTLAGSGVTANQVTMLSLIGSLAVSAILAIYADHPAIFCLLPVWLGIRMGCAKIDGSLAIDFGQKSRLGGILNEVGDLVADAVLVAPLALVDGFSPLWIIAVMALTALSELAGILGPILGGSRRLDGPLGKADRSIVLGVIGVGIAIGAPIQGADLVLALFALLLAVTIVNRVRAALAERRFTATNIAVAL
jgi:CDP-diacylglycerol--glycerol-3-phosphate 3-phosphatidyltransferase